MVGPVDVAEHSQTRESQILSLSFLSIAVSRHLQRFQFHRSHFVALDQYQHMIRQAFQVLDPFFRGYQTFPGYRLFARQTRRGSVSGRHIQTSKMEGHEKLAALAARRSVCFFYAESFDSDYRRRIFSSYREYMHHEVNAAPPEIPMAIATSVPAPITSKVSRVGRSC